MANFKVGSKAPFVKNLLLIEGISRSGKFLLANILNGFSDIEPVQYSVFLEQIPFLYSLHRIDKDTASELLRCEVDLRVYEGLIGRNLNHRIFDKSSIYNSPKYKSLIARSKKENTHDLLKDYQNDFFFSPFIVHETMPNIEIYYDTFPQMKCISMVRNPIDLAYSWYKRGLGKRWGIDPFLFQIPFAKNNSKFPWFIAGREKEYLKLNEMDRSILSIKILTEKTRRTYRSLPDAFKKRILIVDYDDLINDSEGEIRKISNFLKKKPVSEIKQILKKENLPKTSKDRGSSLKEIRKLVDDQYLNELLKLPANYLAIKS